jgi:hypothetical protein
VIRLSKVASFVRGELYVYSTVTMVISVTLRGAKLPWMIIIVCVVLLSIASLKASSAEQGIKCMFYF